MVRDQVFVSYSHADRKWLERLHTQLIPMVNAGTIDVWDDRRIKAGARWQDEIAAALARARVAVLLVTPAFLASDFIVERELPAILSAAQAEGLVVLWVAVKHSGFRETEIAHYQAVNDPDLPLSAMRHAKVDRELVNICARVKDAFRRLTIPVVPAPSHQHAPREGREVAPALPHIRTRAPVHHGERERLSGELESAVARRRELAAVGADIVEVNLEIVALKRRIRGDGGLRPGDVLEDGRYLLLETIGRGGFAKVWRAQDRRHNRAVAIKVLHGELAGDPVCRDRFLRGARIMRELAQEGIVPILDPDGEDDGFHYIVMELMTSDLRRRTLARPFGATEALALIRRVGLALAEAHRRGLVHRDVKPANILLDVDDRPRLTDFDLVGGHDTTGGTRTGALGTFLYAAPELMERPQDCTPAADVYGLAATAIFLLLGKDLPAEFIRNPAAIVAKLPCDARIKAVLTRAIELDPGARFPDAAALCDALERAVVPWPGRAKGFPRWFGSYVLVGPLARRGTGALYLAARDVSGGELDVCVIQTVPAHLPDKDYLQRFRDGAKAAVQLTHENLVRVFDSGEVGDEIYLGMEFVTGHNLRAVWNRCAKKRVAFPMDVAVYIIRELALGLEYLHAFGESRLVHRDVSPRNVLVGFDGTVKLTDFELLASTLKLEKTAPGIIYGSVSYMSPEQARGETLDGRTDLFAAGIILWELLTGRPLYPAKVGPGAHQAGAGVERDGKEGGDGADATPAAEELLKRVSNPDIVAPSKRASRVTPELDRIALKALSPRVEERYPTCAALAADLSNYLRKCSQTTDPHRIGEFLGDLYTDDFETDFESMRGLDEARALLGAGASRLQSPSHPKI